MKFGDLLVPKSGLIRGPFGADIKKSLFVPKTDNTYKVYEQSVVINENVELGNYFISEEYFNNNLKRFEVLENDFLITGAGTLGKIYKVPQNQPKGVINQALIRIRINEEIVDSNFFYYYYKYYIKAIICNINGDSVIPNLPPLPVIKSTEINIPKIYTQKKIGHILSIIDDKIRINNKINIELESKAKALYNYWFVQFDFPDKNGKPYKSSGGKMVYNKALKREIPFGWEVKELSTIAEITMGQSPSGDTYNENNDGTIFFQGCTDFGWRFPTIRKYTTEPARIAEVGDVLLSVRAPVGTLNIADNKCCIGRGISSLRSNKGFDSYLYYVMVNFKQIFDNRNGTGTTFGSITKDDLYSLKVIYPNEENLDKYDSIVSKYNEVILNNHKQNQQLTELRDWLLPMLMNGQVTVSDESAFGKDEVLAMVAEPSTVYEKTVKMVEKKVETKKPKKEKTPVIKLHNVDVYKRTLLAAEIVYKYKNEFTLGHLKLQKMLYLCKESENMNLPMHFLKQAMGPYDNRLSKSIDKQFEEKKWFKYQNGDGLKYTPLENCGKHSEDFKKYFEEQLPTFNQLVETFRKFKSQEIEAVATLYACWKEAIANNELVNDAIIINKFYNWSKEKEKFNKPDLVVHLAWMRENGIYPKISR